MAPPPSQKSTSTKDPVNDPSTVQFWQLYEPCIILKTSSIARSHPHKVFNSTSNFDDAVKKQFQGLWLDYNHTQIDALLDNLKTHDQVGESQLDFRFYQRAFFPYGSLEKKLPPIEPARVEWELRKVHPFHYVQFPIVDAPQAPGKQSRLIFPPPPRKGRQSVLFSAARLYADGTLGPKPETYYDRARDDETLRDIAIRAINKDQETAPGSPSRPWDTKTLFTDNAFVTPLWSIYESIDVYNMTKDYEQFPLLGHAKRGHFPLSHIEVKTNPAAAPAAFRKMAFILTTMVHERALLRMLADNTDVIKFSPEQLSHKGKAKAGPEKQSIEFEKVSVQNIYCFGLVLAGSTFIVVRASLNVGVCRPLTQSYPTLSH
jgi:hypothetical protein